MISLILLLEQSRVSQLINLYFLIELLIVETYNNYELSNLRLNKVLNQILECFKVILVCTQTLKSIIFLFNAKNLTSP